MKKGYIDLHNYMEDAVMHTIDDILSSMLGACKCSKCRLDAMALALNSLPSKYIVTAKGRVYAKLSELEFQSRADVVKELTRAIAKVKRHPKH